ncbi:MAG: O-antigen ligase family protein [Anaerolineae bacterium]|nr:O-antigen ligase family protein [Anaerolineae bacterium]
MESQSGIPRWLEILRNGVLLLAIFLIPFHYKLAIFYPDPTLTATVVPAFCAVYLNLADIPLALAIVLFIATEGKRLFDVPPSLRWLIGGTLALIGLSLISVLAARLPLLTLVLALRLCLMAGLVLMIARTPLDQVAGALIASGCANALLGMFQYPLRRSVGLPFETIVSADPHLVPVVESEGIFYLRVFGFTAHPNVLGAFLIAAALLLAGRILSQSDRDSWIEIAGVGLIVSALALTYSRTAWVGLGLAVLVLLAGHLVQPDLRNRLRVLRIPLVVMLLVAAMFLTTQSRPVGLRFSPTAARASTSDRELLMQDAIMLLKEHPLIGVGGHNFSAAADQAFTITGDYSGAFRWQPVHNFTVLVASELGVFGGITWLWLTLAPWALAFRSWRRGALTSNMLAWLAISVALAAIGLLDHFVWSLPEGMGLMWVVWAGLGSALGQADQRADTR